MRRSRGTGLSLLAWSVFAVLPVLSACSGGAGGDEDAPAAAADASTQTTAVPVRVDTIRTANLDVLVTAPGRTRALRQDRVRAPFASHLVSVSVTDGDRVKAHQVVAEVVAKNSEAALEGARQMLSQATTAADSADASRAVEVARRQLVRRPLYAPADGVVLSHAAEVGDYLDEGEVILTIAEAGTVYFEAQVTQSDLARVSPGQRATISLPAVGPKPVKAVVHGILPSASSQTLSAPVRLDFVPSRPGLAVGLFGTVSIVAGRHDGAVVVPRAAVLRDDVDGVSRMAVVDSTGAAHWVVVQTGTRQGDSVEITSPPLTPGGLVIVDGQVGLPEGAHVRIQP